MHFGWRSQISVCMRNGGFVYGELPGFSDPNRIQFLDKKLEYNLGSDTLLSRSELHRVISSSVGATKAVSFRAAAYLKSSLMSQLFITCDLVCITCLMSSAL